MPNGGFVPPHDPVVDRVMPPSGKSATKWMVVVIVALGLAVFVLGGWVIELRNRVTSLEMNSGGGAGFTEWDAGFVPTTTLAPPVDLPPPDAETARRVIRDALNAVFSSELSVEQRAVWVEDPAAVSDRLTALRSGTCGSGVQVVVTELRFLDDDSAWVRFRFEGPNVPELGTGFSFEGRVFRAPERWQLDAQMVAGVLETAEPYCS
jgi:hypothetical protein